MPALTTCQICGRAIKAKTGVIAHHGYERPDRGSGYQTGSCPGARHVPYEVGHGALDLWIINLGVWITQKGEFIASLKTSPPDSYDVRRRDGYGRYRNHEPEPILAHRPEGFSTDKSPGAFGSSQSYEWAFWNQVGTNERDLKGMRDTLVYAEKRLADWRAPAEKAA